MRKIYVLDTNILLQDPQALFGFDNNIVMLTSTVLSELDKKKNAKNDPELAYRAREAIRLIDETRGDADLVSDGAKLPNGGMLFVEPDGVDQKNLPNGFSIDVPDNKIISSCVHLQNEEKEKAKKSKKAAVPVILVTNDISMSISASVILGAAHVQKYKNRIINLDQEFKGYIELEVPCDVINAIYRDGSWAGTKTRAKKQWNDGMTENLFVTLRAVDGDGNKKSALTVYQNGILHRIPEKQKIFGGVTHKNALQRYAIWALTNPNIPLVILSGPAGTAKTFLSLAAGLEQTYTSQNPNDGQYQKILISRPNTEAGDPGFGFLPGSLHDKMAPLLLPYYDNLENLLSLNEKSARSEKGKDGEKSMVKMQIDDLFATGVIEMCALSYIRGRSLVNSYMICDEAQNASQLLIKDVISRAGSGTKIVIAGDPNQCDSLYLDRHSNGLVAAIDAFKGHPLAAIIRFGDEQSVRSPLAKAAIQQMKNVK